MTCQNGVFGNHNPQAVAEWTRQVKTERAAALARDASQNRHPAVRQLTEDDIRALITSLGDLRDIIRDAAPPMKAAIYEQLGLQVTYLPEQDKLRAHVTVSPDKFAGQRDKYGAMGRVRGASAPKSQCFIRAEFPLDGTVVAVDGLAYRTQS